MFNFFRKKKNAQAESSATSARKTGSKTTLEARYNKLLKKHKKNLLKLDDKALECIKKNHYADKKQWLNAFAICDAAIEAHKTYQPIIELYTQINTTRWGKHLSVDYDDTDYDFWFNKNVEVNNMFIHAGVTCAYSEQSDLYGSARRSYRDIDKKAEYLRIGVAYQDPASMSDYGYELYTGRAEQGRADTIKGRQMLERAVRSGYQLAEAILLYIDLQKNKGKDNPQLLKKIESCISTTQPPFHKPYYLLADYYMKLRIEVDEILSEDEKIVKSRQLKKTNCDKAVEIMKKGVESGDIYSKYQLGMNILNGIVDGADKSEGIRLLEQAYSHNLAYAANILGSYYYYTQDANFSVEKAILWHEKAALYCYADSSFELAYIYLYNEQYKNIEKGLKYIEQAIEDGSHRAMSEKAYLMLETDILPTNTREAKSLLEKAMEMGNEYAPYRLGLAYQNAEFGGEYNYTKALEMFEIGVQRNHLHSLEQAGKYYRIGLGGDTEEATRKAVEYLSRACEMDSDFARIELSLCYETGFGVEKDLPKAFDLLKAAARKGYPHANLRMASYYEDGILGEPDLKEAFNQYNIAAQAGIPEALYNKGRFYKYALGIPEDPSQAMHLFRQAAELDSPSALVEIALAYETGYDTIEPDAQKAIDYMTQAAQAGYTYAQYKLGSYYYNGLLETNIHKALEWYTRACEEGGYPYAASTLGDYYFFETEDTEDSRFDKAFAYYKIAEEKGVVTEGLGLCYEYGLGVEENEAEAFRCHTLAANEGYTVAKCRLGMAYKNGRGTGVNLTEAYRWLSDAAQEGNQSAQYEAAMMLLNGEGVDPNEARGVQMLMKAAEENYDPAQFELGNCYRMAKGVAEDQEQAMYWYRKAADNGNEQAQKIADKHKRGK